jgi:hypothetical protein
MRLVSEGKMILLDPTIQGQHLKRWTLTSMVRTDLFRRGAPWVRLLLDRGSSSTTLNLGWRHRASAAASVVCIAELMARKPKPAAAALTLLLVLNAPFYVLLYTKRGSKQAAVGVPLHMLHHLISIAAVPIGLSQHLTAKATRAKAD